MATSRTAHRASVEHWQAINVGPHQRNDSRETPPVKRGAVWFERTTTSVRTPRATKKNVRLSRRTPCSARQTASSQGSGSGARPPARRRKSQAGERIEPRREVALHVLTIVRGVSRKPNELPAAPEAATFCRASDSPSPGGLDSTTVAAHAVREARSARPQHWLRPTPHRELNSGRARAVAERLGIPLVEVDAAFYARLASVPSLITSDDHQMPAESRRAAEMASDIPNTYVPFQHILVTLRAAGPRWKAGVGRTNARASPRSRSMARSRRATRSTTPATRIAARSLRQPSRR